MSMQQVINSKERNQAFLKFLLFFLITIALAIAATYFDAQLPFTENRELQTQITVHSQEEVNQEKFVENMNQAFVYLDSLDKDLKNQDQIRMQLEGKIDDLFKLQQKGNSPYAKMNQVITYRLTELKTQKIQLLKLSDKANALASVEQKLNDCQMQLIQKEALIESLRKGSGF